MTLINIKIAIVPCYNPINTSLQQLQSPTKDISKTQLGTRNTLKRTLSKNYLHVAKQLTDPAPSYLGGSGGTWAAGCRRHHAHIGVHTPLSLILIYTIPL